MEKDKLEIAADIASDNAVFDSNPWNVFNDGFIEGAEWLQSQPIVDRLTEGDVDKLNNILFLMRGMAASHQMSYDCLKHISNAIYDVFGKEIFIERQSKYAVVNTAIFGK